LGDDFADPWSTIVAGVNNGQFDGDRRIRYKVLATMMSGEQTTSLFNVILNYWLHEFSKRELGFRSEFAIEGDDGVYCSDIVDINQIRRVYAELGFSIKIKLADINTVSFLSSHLM
jgi:hypothetical protein